MKVYQVYHAVQPNFGFGEKLSFPKDFVLVAKVEAESLEEVFRLTNHIDHDWRQNPGVMPSNVARRSTSVGDVVVEVGGKTWECAPCGWEEIGGNANA